MSMKKAFDQTIRDLKREVNKKVRKVPSIEQKVLDATSNEPWGPNGSILADIAQASRNYHEYHMIMAVIWKRINDTGKNWRHVYKALTVLEYLVAHGSERVIDEIREHSYQISTLSDFQYIDTSGRDQGNNVQRKSQSLVLLVNDKERIQEVREKAANNRDKYKDDNYRGRSRSVNDQYGPRSRSVDVSRANDDDRHSARESSYQPKDDLQDGRPMKQKLSEQNLGAPPSYEEAIGDSKSPFGERDGETPVLSALHSSSSPTAAQSSSPIADGVVQSSSPTVSVNHNQANSEHDDVSHPNMEANGFDEFDPRGFAAAAPTPPPEAPPSSSNNAEMDLFGSLSEVFSPNPLGIMPVADAISTASDPAFTAATSRDDVSTQAFADPFGESPFKAILSDEPPAHTQLAAQKVDPTPNVDFPDALAGIDFNAADIPSAQYPSQDAHPSQEHDILAGILPPSGSLPSFPSSPTPFQQNMNVPSTPYFYPSQLMMGSNIGYQVQTGSLGNQNGGFLGDFGPTIPSSSSQSAPMNPVALLPHQPSNEKQKFEPKSAVWADTLSKGLVDFNISGAKCNPTADIGVDFESLNRKEKRMEKPSIAPATSTVSMGKAMGSGSGVGRAGASAIRPPSNPAMGPGMGMGMDMGMGAGPGIGMGMGGYGSMNQQPMGMGMGGNMGMGMNIGMSQGAPMQPPNGVPPGPSIGSYNPGMGRGGYPQQPYGGGYR